MKEVLLNINNGDTIYRIEDSVIISFAGKREVLSSSIYNGGWRSDLQAVLNHHPKPNKQAMSIKDYTSNMINLCQHLGYNPHSVATMGTGVSMQNVVVKREVSEELEIIVVVTAGAEGNAGRAGDKALYPGKSEKLPPLGTINIMVYFNAELLPGTMTRAIVMATEAKTAALQELMIGSKFSNGLATGTGTDQIIVISDPQGKFLVNDCGKHTKPGEVVGRLVKNAVKEALYKHNGYDRVEMHKVLRRMSRFGVNHSVILHDYYVLYGEKISDARIRKAIDKIDNGTNMVALTSLYAHLLDQWYWNLLSNDEVELWTDNLLANIVQDKYKNENNDYSIEYFVNKWKCAYYSVLNKELMKHERIH